MLTELEHVVDHDLQTTREEGQEHKRELTDTREAKMQCHHVTGVGGMIIVLSGLRPRHEVNETIVIGREAPIATKGEEVDQGLPQAEAEVDGAQGEIPRMTCHFLTGSLTKCLTFKSSS